jgi:hypothetical protein
MSNRETTETAAWLKTRARVLSIKREAMKAAATQSAERDAVPVEHELIRRMFLSMLGGNKT